MKKNKWFFDKETTKELDNSTKHYTLYKEGIRKEENKLGDFYLVPEFHGFGFLNDLQLDIELKYDRDCHGGWKIKVKHHNLETNTYNEETMDTMKDTLKDDVGFLIEKIVKKIENE